MVSVFSHSVRFTGASFGIDHIKETIRGPAVGRIPRTGYRTVVMSLPGTFKKLFAVAGGATAAVMAVTYTGQLYKMNYQIDEADAFAIKRINNAYAKLQKVKKCNSLLKKHLTPAVLQQLEGKKTKLGASLYDIIRSGLYNPDSEIGVYAADPESYHKFAPIFDQILEDYHGFKPRDKQPADDLGEGRSSEFPPLDPKRKYITSVRIRCIRSVVGYPFNPLLSADDYIILEQKIKNALRQIDDPELRGIYYSLDGISEKVKNDLGVGHFIFDNNNGLLKHANAYTAWPTGRGIFHNRDKSFLVWINEEDHLSIISLDEGSDVGRVLDRLNRGLKALEGKMTFARDDRLGWLTSCPSNLGAAVRASVQIRLPNLCKRSDFMEICDKLNLRVSRSRSISSGTPDVCYFISNKTSLGLTQYEAVKQMYDGVKELIRMEEQC